MPKIILNLSEGILEVEGDEAFAKAVYEDFKKLQEAYIGQGKPVRQVTQSQEDWREEKKTSGGAKNIGSSKKKSAKKGSPTFVKDLDLSSKSNSEDLKDFYKMKSPSSNLERNAVFVYFLKNIMKVGSVSMDHIYTCYKYVGEKVPGALEQSLLDTASRKGWIDTSNMSSIASTVGGENFVEHDLPKGNSK